jgi:rhodanese-related sulfurtransferase
MRKHVNRGSELKQFVNEYGKRLAVFFVAALMIIAIAACQTPAAPQAAVQPVPAGQAAVRAPLPAEVSVAEAAKKRAAGAFILDVRTVEEWNEYHVPGSKLIPIDELGARLAEVPKDREVVVVCRSGNRSAKGRDLLLNAGYAQVTSLAGGLQTWRSAGQPVE